VWRVSATDSLAGAVVGDTLAQVANLSLEVDLEALRHRELWVREISLNAGPVDVPTIVELFPAKTDTTVAVQDDTLAAIPYLRESDLPLVPSFALDNLKIKVRDTKLTEVLTLNAAGLEAKVEMRAGHGAAVHLQQGMVRLEMLQDELVVLNADRLEMALDADLNNREFRLDSLLVTVAKAGPPAMSEAWAEAEPVSLHLEGQGNWTSTGLNVALEGLGSLPGPEHVRPLLPAEFPSDISGPLVGGFKLDASVPDLSAPEPTAKFRMDFTETAWLDRLLLVAAIDQGKVVVDTLNLAAMGARVTASGAVDSTEVDARLGVNLDQPTLLHLFGGPALADADASLSMQATVMGKWPLPAVNLDLVASARTSDLEVPVVNCRVQTRDRIAELMLSLDQGMSSNSVDLDSLQLNWSGDLSRPDSLSHRFDLGVWSPMGRVALGGTGTIDTLRTVVLDSLVVVSMDSTMRTAHSATITHGPGPSDLRIEDFLLTGGLGTIGVDCNLNELGLTLKMKTDLLLNESFLMAVAPNEIWSGGGGNDLAIKVSLDLEGGDDGPVFTGQAGALLMPHREDPEVGVDLNFYLVRGDSSGLGADLNLHADKTSLLTGQFRWPGRPDLETGKWVPDPQRGLVVRFPNQTFNLADLNQIMPPDMALDGVLNFNGEMLEQFGDDRRVDPSGEDSFLHKALINGHIGVEKLEVDLPNRSRLALIVDTSLEGTVSDPLIKGKIKVISGYFRIPEVPRALLPVEGESLLWQAMAEEAGASDDSVTIQDFLQPENQGPLLGEAKPAFIPDLDVSLEMPGNVIVNGYGLNIELEGELQATRGQDQEGTDMVVLKGQAGVRQGTLKFMNNVFEVVKANVRFNKAAPPNPHLDIKLSADVSGYLIHLNVSGFADDPVTQLTSEPDMNEADIIAVLLFGQPANNLDNDQRGRANDENDPGAQLRENLAALAVVFGGAGLQNQMSNTLGVDMVEMGSGTDGDNTLMVGKFLTPKVLLKYNQSLEKSGTYFMTMEYRLSQYFKLISTYGQGEEASGLELKWTRRY
jgi:hypothetical protein